ncbi:hypothetical protein AMAG_17903 [Allomyces macrogynus ATCC 38327]|uniref:Uncharacterized protein n=1 Tax=Allomyces macrogynus (strain ATCC 38327) TaxID=578462 RepID=A0A0L0S1N4_ALLM3|nr:hypothetical protein AMAG_17903 [Allomyces macrogynus ATCC 38327]|eukprot:KNE56330.1 hypothetical protein AMAG_17903 [Allomyces macrogynus ATCC 38327]
MEDACGPPATRPISRSSTSAAGGEDLMSSQLGPHQAIVETELGSMAVSARGASNGFPTPYGASMDTPPAAATDRNVRRRSVPPHEVEAALWRHEADRRMDEPDGAPRNFGLSGEAPLPPRRDALRSPRSRQNASRSPREHDRPSRPPRRSPSPSRRPDRGPDRRPMDLHRSPERWPVDQRWSPGRRPMDSIQSPGFRSIEGRNSPGRRRFANGHDSPRDMLRESRGSRHGDEGSRKERQFENERDSRRRARARDDNEGHSTRRGDDAPQKERMYEDERGSHYRTRDDDEGHYMPRGDERSRRDRMNEDEREGRRQARADETRYELHRDSRSTTRVRPRPRSRSASPQPRSRTSPSPIASRNSRADLPPRSSRDAAGRLRSAERTRDSRRSSRRPRSPARRSRSPGPRGASRHSRSPMGSSRMNDPRPRSPVRPPCSPAPTRGRDRSARRSRSPMLDCYVPARPEAQETRPPPRSPSRHWCESRDRRTTPPPAPSRRPQSPPPSRNPARPSKDRPNSFLRHPVAPHPLPHDRSFSVSRSRSRSLSRSRSPPRTPRQHPLYQSEPRRPHDRDADVERRPQFRSRSPRQHPSPRPESRRSHDRGMDVERRSRSRSRPESQRSHDRDSGGRSRHGSSQRRKLPASPRPRSRASRSRQQRSPSESSSVTLPSPEAISAPQVISPTRADRSPRSLEPRENHSSSADVRPGSRADVRVGSFAATAPADRANVSIDNHPPEHADPDAMAVDPVPLDAEVMGHGSLEPPVAVAAPITVVPVSPRKEPIAVAAPVLAEGPMPVDKPVPVDEPMQVDAPAPHVDAPRLPPPPIVWTGPDTVNPPQSKTSKSKSQRNSNTRAQPSSSSSSTKPAAVTASREPKSSQRRRPRSPSVPRPRTVSQSPPPPASSLDRHSSESGGTVFSRLSGSSRKRPAGDLRQTLTNHPHHNRHSPEHDIDDFVDPDAVLAPASKSRRSTFSNRMLGPVAPTRTNQSTAPPAGRLPAPPPLPPAPTVSLGRVVVPATAPALSMLAYGPQPRKATPPPPPAPKPNPLKYFLSKMRK